ncbi:MAG: TRAP transporter small permease subunit [Candidatus Adiutrix sp.]|jgi:TRAP-type mannitol/chloroaromatic compound transport system permease small subunit|nr:TRAP transporter small permease subunit [Candidatus Adiutrix sp.]
MPVIIKKFVHTVDAINNMVGKWVLYLVFVIMGILIYSAISRYFFKNPVIWGVEMAQFSMVVYYILGGGFSILLQSHVRMDVLYTRWGRRRQSGMDAFTSLFLIAYLSLLLYGGISSTIYSIEFNQHNNTAWGPPIAPLKCVLDIGILLMLLQSISEFFKAIARTKGIVLGLRIPDLRLVEASDLEKISGVEVAVRCR